MTTGNNPDPDPFHPVTGWWHGEAALNVTVGILTGHDRHHKANGTDEPRHGDGHKSTIGNTVQGPSWIIDFRHDKGGTDTGH